METDIRWKQRFNNFQKALGQLEEALFEVDDSTSLEKEGTIHRFEFTHELAWKVMKDYLTYEGIQGIVGARFAVKQAFNKGIIQDGEIWMDMLESRNLTVRTYDESILQKEYDRIKNQYFARLKAFSTTMLEKL